MSSPLIIDMNRIDQSPPFGSCRSCSIQLCFTPINQVGTMVSNQSKYVNGRPILVWVSDVDRGLYSDGEHRFVADLVYHKVNRVYHYYYNLSQSPTLWEKEHEKKVNSSQSIWYWCPTNVCHRWRWWWSQSKLYCSRFPLALHSISYNFFCSQFSWFLLSKLELP